MGFQEIITKAIKAPWHNRGLWFYGIWLAIFSGVGSFNVDQESIEQFQTQVNMDFVYRYIFYIAGAAIMIWLTAMIIASWSIEALIKGADVLDQKKAIDRKKLGRFDGKTIWNLIKLNVVIPTLFVVSAVIVGILVVVLLTLLPKPLAMAIGIGLGLSALAALVVALIYLSVIWPLATVAIVLKKERPVAAIRSAIGLTRGRFKRSLFFGIVIGLVVAGIAALFMLPLTLAFFAFLAAVSAKVTAWIVLAAAIGSVMVLVYTALIGYLQAFAQIAWVLWWKELNKSEKENK